jgi:hypothetical protein
MPITPTTFSYSKLLSTTPSARAYADVALTNPTYTRVSATIQCLVDTGSDYTILPMSLAGGFGIVPSGPPVSFRTAGGVTYSLPSQPGLDLMIEGYAIKATVAFSTSAAFIPIVGCLDLVNAFDFGFDDVSWFWG